MAMKRSYLNVSIVILISFIMNLSLSGQHAKDSARILMNTVKVNITNPMIFGEKYNVIGYERVLNKHHSVSVNMGRFSLPKFVSINTDSIQLQKGYHDKGFNFAFDYRFYLKSENKHDAPRGVYIGPYYSFNYLERENNWTLNTISMAGDVRSDIRLNINMIGAQLGYQFVIKRRIAIDLIVFGPGVWFYNVNTNLSTTLDPEDEAMLVGKINEILSAKLPGHEILVDTGEFHKKGSYYTSSAGLRYVINIGFRF